MTTGPEELSLNYLLDPAFQLVNTAGRPLTNGWIEVYYHGTRDKYYCASDFDGTLHPFKIPLDSLGSNIVLADPNFSYDIYVYNSFGSLQMSRYNVNPGSGSGGGSSGEGGPAEHWSSDTAGGASTTVTGGTTVYLTLPSSEDQPEFVDHTTDTAIFLKEGLYHIDAVVSFKQDEDDLQNIIKDIVVNTGLIGWDAQMTGQKNWTGPESTDDDRHFLELHTVVSVPEDLLQPLYFQIASPVDLDSAAIEKLDIVKLEAGGNGIKYTGGYGIEINNQVISVSGMMPESSAANFVDNSTYQVDIQNIYEAIAETSGQIPSGVATQDWVTDYVVDYTSAFITEDALDGYATQQWVENQHYITSADLPESVPLVAGEGISIVDTSASTIISIDSAYSPGVSEEWVEDYVSDATSAFITSADIPDIPADVVTSGELATVSGDIVSQIPSLDGYATEQFVEDYTSAFITSADAVFGYQNGGVLDDTYKGIKIVNGDTGNEHLALHRGESWYNHGMLVPSAPGADKVLTTNSAGKEVWALRSEFATSADLAGYATEQYVQDYTSAFITSADVPHLTQEQADWNEDDPSEPDYIKNKPSIPSIEGLASEQYVQDYTSAFITSADIPDVPADVVTSGQLATVSGNIMNQIPDTSDMATKTWVGQQGYLTSIPAEYATSGDLVTLSGAIEAEIPSYTAGDNISIVNDEISVSGTTGLIAGENISITASGDNYVISSTGGGGGWVDQVYHDSTLTGDGTQADPLSITSASNWTQAYDAVNASASSWNDAAGMNEYPISAGPGMSITDVSGVTVFSHDETVLWSGSSVGTNFALSEAPNHFQYIRVDFRRSTELKGFMTSKIFPVESTSVSFPLMLVYENVDNSTSFKEYIVRYNGNTAQNSFAFNSALIRTSTVGGSVTIATDSSPTLEVIKVVGINRIAGGN